MKPHAIWVWSLRSLKIALVVAFMFFSVGAGPQAHQGVPKGTAEVRVQEGVLKGLDEYIAKGMRDHQVPGLAIAIVKDDGVVLAKGYGVRKLGESTPVTERTIFALGSTTKAFTAAALAILVDEGKIKWDDPVIKHLPSFRLKDPYVTRKITVRDLLAHRTGLERHEMVWYHAARSREELLRRLQYAELTWDFRTEFSYQNILYMAAGQIIPAVTGKSWDDFVSERILKPLGMTSSSTSFKALAKASNFARPHGKIDDKVQVIPGLDLDNVGPAGSINSTVVDMARWLRLQLGEGSYHKQRLLSPSVITEMRSPQIVLRGGTPNGHFKTYGFGWFLQDYRGQMLVEHGGNVDGMTAQVAMIPEKKLGVVILSNMDGTQLPAALMYRILDAYLGAPAQDWSGEASKFIKEQGNQQKEVEKKAVKDRVQGTKASLVQDKYAGSYTDDLYGEVKIVKEKDKLVIHFGPAFIGDLEHWNYDTFRIHWRNRRMGKGFVTFHLTAAAKVEELKFDIGGVFKRASDKSKDTPAIALTKEELRKFIGIYESKTPSVKVSIEMMGDQLKAVSAGLPMLTLVPYKPTRFKLSGLPQDVFLDFELVDGKVKGLTISRTEGPTFKLVPMK